jgi:hypothetical protein
MKMKLNMNVEELRKEILEGARAVPLCKQRQGGGVGEGTEKGSCTGREGGRECEVEDGEGEETSVTGEATEVVYEVEGGVVGLEVSLEEGMLGWLG